MLKQYFFRDFQASKDGQILKFPVPFNFYRSDLVNVAALLVESLAVRVGLWVQSLHLVGGVVLGEDGEDGAYLHPPLRARRSPEQNKI